ncbi:MAG: dTDP-glucose 4,6-dehydratase [Patescibacteria group bacterium]
MKIVVTGGAGFIGSNFIHYLLRKYPNCSVVNFDLLTYAGNLENLKFFENDARYRFVRGDIADKKLTEELVSQSDLVVHFAAESHVDRSIADSSAFIHTNIVGTHTLLEVICKNPSVRFHHVSTDEVFGSLGPDDFPFNEKSPYDPKSPYSASKAASDHLVRAYQHTYNLPITVSNCSNNYGPYQFPEKLIPFFVTNLIEGKKVPLYGDGANVRDWLHVDDHCEAIDLIIQKGKIGETYCIGGNAEKTNKEITALLLKIMNKGDDWIEFVPDRPGHDRRYAIDFSKIKNELDWEPKVGFESGIMATVKWYQENENWWRSLKLKNQKLLATPAF